MQKSKQGNVARLPPGEHRRAKYKLPSFGQMNNAARSPDCGRRTRDNYMNGLPPRRIPVSATPPRHTRRSNGEQGVPTRVVQKKQRSSTSEITRVPPCKPPKMSRVRPPSIERPGVHKTKETNLCEVGEKKQEETSRSQPPERCGTERENKENALPGLPETIGGSTPHGLFKAYEGGVVVQETPHRSPPDLESGLEKLGLHHSLKEFSEDPIDPRFRKAQKGPLGLTPLGLCVRLWWWLQRQEQPKLVQLIREILERECPDTLAELEKHV